MVKQVSPRELHAWLQSMHPNGRPMLLDVREPAEWHLVSVRAEGAELLRMPMHTVPPRLRELDPARPVAVLCHHGGRSMQVALFLVQHGFSHVVNVAGGIDAWSLQLDPALPRY